MYEHSNPNPYGKYVGDCVVRAISIATGEDWDYTYLAIALQGFLLKDMPSSNDVWGTYLRDRGFRRYAIPNTCPYCYTIEDFAFEHPRGTYIVATGTHIVAIVDGSYMDAWDSGSAIPQYYWVKED